MESRMVLNALKNKKIAKILIDLFNKVTDLNYIL